MAHGRAARGDGQRRLEAERLVLFKLSFKESETSENERRRRGLSPSPSSSSSLLRVQMKGARFLKQSPDVVSGSGSSSSPSLPELGAADTCSMQRRWSGGADGIQGEEGGSRQE